MRTSCLLVLFVLLPAGLPAAVSGVLTDPSGAPVAGMEVQIVGQEISAVTDARGAFTLDLPPGTYTLDISGHEFSAAFGEGDATPIRIPFFSERVIVEPPAAEGVEVPRADLASAPGASLTDQLAAQPGLALNGLGGATQSVSIGGLAKHRVRMELNGYRVEGDRRAGADFATIVPSLVDGVRIFKGGTGLTHGSEAIGGVIDADLPRPGDAGLPVEAAAGYGDNNDDRFALAKLTRPGAVLALAYEKAGDYEAGDGTVQPGHFTRYNLSTTLKRENNAGLQFFDFFFSRGQDMGKPQVTTRPTEYPENMLGILGMRGFGGAWRYQAGLIYQKLVTATTGEESDLSSLNVHAKAFYEHDGLTLGAELYTRQNVDADVTLASGLQQPLKDAWRWEISPLAAYEKTLGPAWSVEAGLRWNQIWASNGDRGRTDGLPTGLARLRWAKGRLSFDTSLFNTFRFATLEELYYTGLTARGYVEGNPELDPERGVGGGLEAVWRQGGWEASLGYQAQQVKDFIERYKKSKDLYAYRNIPGARIQDVTAAFRTGDLRLSASWSKGKDTDTGDPVDDIPALRATGLWRRTFGPVEPWVRVLWADTKTDAGPNEVERDSYTVISLGCRWATSDTFSLEIKADNLLDEAYFPVADGQAVPAMGRNVSVKARMGF
jgi:outer membrane receptor protein involved in Fe transport